VSQVFFLEMARAGRGRLVPLYHFGSHWGVLADDEEEASKSNVLAAQSRCYPLPAEIHIVSRQDDGDNDSPDLTWPGRLDPYS